MTFSLAKTAFVLSGGGAKGAYQVGVMKQLIKVKGIMPDRIYGTSTGALQAAGYVHLGMDRLESEWLKIMGRSDIMTYNWFPHIFTLGLTLDGVYHMGPLKERLKWVQDQPREPGIVCDAVVTKVSLATGEVKYCQYDEPDFLESILASCSIPVINPPVNGWVDGGVRDQTPIAGAIRDGYERIICIITNPLRRTIEPWTAPNGILPFAKTLVRVADDILSYEVWLDEIRQIKKYIDSGVNIEVYAPDELLLQTQEFDPHKIRAAIEQGFMSKPENLDFLAGGV